MLNDMTLKGLILKIEEYYRVTKQEKYLTTEHTVAVLGCYLDDLCANLDKCENFKLNKICKDNLVEMFIRILIIAKLSNIELDKLMLEKFEKKINSQNEEV